MRVAISVLGRFHAFDLARELQRANALGQLITSYPRYEVKKYSISPHLTTSRLLWELLPRGWRLAQNRAHWKTNPQYFFCKGFDLSASRALRPGSDIFLGFAGASLRTIRRARELGMKTLVERSSAHILTQTQLLEEEYRRYGLKFEETHQGVIDQELIEYDEADYISVPSLFVKRTFLERGFSESRVLHVPLGVDLERFTSQPRRDSVFRVIYAGSLSLRKGVPYLLEAFHSLDLPNAELCLIGGMTEPMKAIVDKYRSPKIILHGHVSQARLAELYSQGDVFCFPSIEDGFGIVVAQAMASGLPVIASANTGASDLIREGSEGFVVPIRAVNALKERIEWGYRHRDELRRMGESARAKVERGFSWGDYAAKCLVSYSKILRSALKVA